MNYLISGGAGFIGSHLAEELLKNRNSVTVIDNLSTGSIKNIEHLKTYSTFKYIIDDCVNKSLMAELIDECDVVYHLAAAVGVQLIVSSPIKTIETNITLTEIVLDLASKKKRPVFIASTSEVYGKSLDIPFKEDGNLVMGATSKGRWSYACSKAIDEFLALSYWKEKKLPTVVARLFNTVGPKQTGQYGMVVPNFTKQALSNKPITVFGDGTQTRCFTHVSDVVRALIELMKNEKCYGEVFNIGNNQEISILNLAKEIKTISKSNSEIIYIPYMEAYGENFEDMPRRVPDTSKIKNFINWEPIKSLDQILNDVINYHKNK